MAMRKVRARLLKLNDLLDGDNSESDSDKEEKAPEVKTVENAPPVIVPPPIPQNMPPPPPGQVVQPPVVTQKPKIKK